MKLKQQKANLCKKHNLKFFKIHTSIPAFVQIVEYLLNILLRDVVGDALQEKDHFSKGEALATIRVNLPKCLIIFYLAIFTFDTFITILTLDKYCIIAPKHCWYDCSKALE